MSPHTTDGDTTGWTVEDLHHLRDDGEPGTEIVAYPWTQTEWDQHQVRQLHAAEDAVDYLAADPGKPDSILVRDALLVVGSHRAAREHMGATAHEDQRSIYAAMWDGKTPHIRRLSEDVPWVMQQEVVEPTRVIPPRGPGGRFIAKDSTS